MLPAVALPKDRPILVTGAAGFIGFHVCRRLAAEGYSIVGLDNLNGYYDPELKRARLGELGRNIRFHELDIENGTEVAGLFERTRPAAVIHLAAQAGVRYSLENPVAYANSNVLGFLHVLEGCRSHPVEHLVAASSSSVYGLNARLPYAESDPVEHPISLYAATKRADELMSHTYAHLFQIPISCLRFFTVYGPWGRPDMAYFSFAKAIFEGRPIKVFNHGRLQRDFTYIEDIIEGVMRVLVRPPLGSPPHRIFNIGNHRPVELLKFIGILESAIGRKAQVEMLPMQPGDVLATYADIAAIRQDCGFEPKTTLEEGLPKFIDWFRSYYGVA